TLLARAHDNKQNKRRESLIEHREKAFMSRELVRLKQDVPITEGLETFTLQPPNGPKLISFLKAMEFTTLTRRVAEITDCDASAIEAAHVPVQWGKEARGPDLDPGTASATSAPVAAEDRKSVVYGKCVKRWDFGRLP